MRKLFVLFLILSLLLPAAALAENPRRAEWQEKLSVYDLEELLDINAALENLLFEKKINTIGVEVPPGEYTVGADFPAGTYRVEFPDLSDVTMGTFTAVDPADYSPYYDYYISTFQSTKIGKIELQDGMTLTISNVSAVFYTYTGLFN